MSQRTTPVIPKSCKGYMGPRPSNVTMVQLMECGNVTAFYFGAFRVFDYYSPILVIGCFAAIVGTYYCTSDSAN